MIWTYLDLFGQSNVSSLVLVDQMAVGTVCPSWSEEQKACYGASATGDAVMQLVSSIADEAEDPRATFLEDMFSEDGCGYWMVLEPKIPMSAPNHPRNSMQSKCVCLCFCLVSCFGELFVFRSSAKQNAAHRPFSPETMLVDPAGLSSIAETESRHGCAASAARGCCRLGAQHTHG